MWQHVPWTRPRECRYLAGTADAELERLARDIVLEMHHARHACRKQILHPGFRPKCGGPFSISGDDTVKVVQSGKWRATVRHMQLNPDEGWPGAWIWDGTFEGCDNGATSARLWLTVPSTPPPP